MVIINESRPRAWKEQPDAFFDEAFSDADGTLAPRDGWCKVVQSFGLSFDEPRRVSKVRNRFVGLPWAEARFPLFDLERSRGDCLSYLKGSVDPPRSSPLRLRVSPVQVELRVTTLA